MKHKRSVESHMTCAFTCCLSDLKQECSCSDGKRRRVSIDLQGGNQTLGDQSRARATNRENRAQENSGARNCNVRDRHAAMLTKKEKG